MQEIGNCWNCSVSMTELDYGRETLCLGCGKPTRVCRNCAEYAPGKPNECLEPMAEHVLRKDGANMCEFFKPHMTVGAGGQPVDDLIAAAEALFK